MRVCPRCKNDDPSLFSIRNNEFYCRACINLLGKIHEVEEESRVIDSEVNYDFELTQSQKEISKKLVEVGLNQDCLVEAVCGAGKTEICLELVSYALSIGKKVGWMVARRQVVLQLGERLQSMFENLKVICVTGGYTSDLNGDLIVLTAHQLYRYPHYFDLLIIDEPDAFPYVNNKLLEGLADVSCIGTKVYLSATPDNSLYQKSQVHFRLDQRPHFRPLIIPKVIKSIKEIGFIVLLYYLRKMKPCLIFVPTIKEAKWLSRVFRINMITSEIEDKDEMIRKLLNNEIDVLITTTLLERGVTFKGINVIVFGAQHPIFDEASLIQISGRVDRSFNYCGGECLFLSFGSNKSITQCLNRLKQHNQNAFGV